jgi:hypothetical protein
MCYDEYGPGFIARLDSVRAMVWPPLRGLQENFLECPVCQSTHATPEERAPVASAIPTLILTGEFDPRTPTEFGRRIASTLSHAWLFEIPGATHGGQPAGCALAILGQFLNDPLREPDASCIEGMPPFEFRTQWPERAAAERVRIERAVDLPRHSYPVETPATGSGNAEFALARPVERW